MSIYDSPEPPDEVTVWVSCDACVWDGKHTVDRQRIAASSYVDHWTCPNCGHPNETDAQEPEGF